MITHPLDTALDWDELGEMPSFDRPPTANMQMFAHMPVNDSGIPGLAYAYHDVVNKRALAIYTPTSGKAAWFSLH